MAVHLLVNKNLTLFASEQVQEVVYQSVEMELESDQKNVTMGIN